MKPLLTSSSFKALGENPDDVRRWAVPRGADTEHHRQADEVGSPDFPRNGEVRKCWDVKI